MDNTKVYCEIHPYEIITNICLKGTSYLIIDECFSGLCATCIESHT